MVREVSDLASFLQYRAHDLSQAMEPGLERLQQRVDEAGLSLPCPLISVAGTNGKGSCCAYLQSMANNAGIKTGLYTSPHLFHFSERIRLAGERIAEADLLQAFRVLRESVDVSCLTVFEFDTLLAVQAMSLAEVELAILEVGMGGRLDAVNCWDADVAVVTNIGIDHQAWLGVDREQIAVEKAGIFRQARPVVCGDLNPPASLIQSAAALSAPMYRLGEAFGADFCARGDDGGDWTWWSTRFAGVSSIPMLSMHGRHQLGNAATAIAALRVLGLGTDKARGKLNERLSTGAIRDGLKNVTLVGRCEQRVLDYNTTPITVWLDVAHNLDAVGELLEQLLANPIQGDTYAVFACLNDKDVEGIWDAMFESVDHWLLASLNVERGLMKESLKQQLEAGTVGSVPASDKLRFFDEVAVAFEWALAHAQTADRIVVFGSFFTVAAVCQTYPALSES